MHADQLAHPPGCGSTCVGSRLHRRDITAKLLGFVDAKGRPQVAQIFCDGRMSGDMAPVAGLIRFPNVMEVNPKVPAKTVPEFIALTEVCKRREAEDRRQEREAQRGGS